MRKLQAGISPAFFVWMFLWISDHLNPFDACGVFWTLWFKRAKKLRAKAKSIGEPIDFNYRDEIPWGELYYNVPRYERLIERYADYISKKANDSPSPTDLN